MLFAPSRLFFTSDDDKAYCKAYPVVPLDSSSVTRKLSLAGVLVEEEVLNLLILAVSKQRRFTHDACGLRLFVA